MLATNTDLSGPAAAAARSKPLSDHKTGSSRRVRLTALGLGVVAFFFFLWRVEVPNASFYDEEQYIGAARALIAGAPNPNPEAPPLGKIMIAAGIRIFGDDA